jgi:hypothetical protein
MRRCVEEQRGRSGVGEGGWAGDTDARREGKSVRTNDKGGDKGEAAHEGRTSKKSVEDAKK